MLFTILLFCLQGVFCGGNEFHIKSAEEFITFSNDVSSGISYSETTVFLDNDIDFSGDLSEQFEPIGKNISTPFKGVFDGQGHTINGLTISSSLQYTGLFGYTNGATIRNVVLDTSCSVASSYKDSNSALIGGIIGWLYDSSVESSVNMASVSFNGSTTGGSYSILYLGGIVGRAHASNKEAIVKNCANYGAVTHSGTASSNAYIGGIVGNFAKSSSSKISIQNCLNYGAITHDETSSSSLHIGGILGDASGDCVVENCVSAGVITSNQTSSYTGSIIGCVNTNAKANITRCHWTDVVGNFNASGSGSPESGNEAFLVTLNTTTVNNLNNYSNTWNKWLLNTNSKSVTFKVNGKSFILSTQLILLPSLAESENHTFSGWFEDEGCTTKFSKSSIEEDITLYSGWTYTVTFDFGNGTIVNETCNYNTTINYPENLVREGYTFNSWDYRPERMPAYDITVTAQWNEVPNNLVEIVFDTKDITEKDVEDFVKKFTDKEFTIIKFEDTPSGEVRAIIEFKDNVSAKDFVNNVRSSSDSGKKGVVKVSFWLKKIESSSLMFVPFFVILGFAIL